MASNPKSATAQAGAVGVLHSSLVMGRRVEVLARWFAEWLPLNVRVLDVGCGDGAVSALLQSKRPDIRVQGIDVLPRLDTHISVQIFDGAHFPFDDASFHVVMFSDVLHHSKDTSALLKEAHRVSAQYVLIKDHYLKGLAAKARLCFMDWVGNARYGVALPYNYWREEQWNSAWQATGFVPEKLATRLGLYPTPADWIFGANLHFIALLKKKPAV